MKTEISYELTKQAMEKIAWETERAVEQEQVFEFDAKGEIKDLVLEAGGYVIPGEGKLRLCVQYYDKDYKDEFRRTKIYSDKMLSEENVQEYLQTIINCKEKSKEYSDFKDNFKKIVDISNNSRMIYTAYKKGLSQDDLVEIATLAKQVAQLDKGYLKFYFNRSFYYTSDIYEEAIKKSNFDTNVLKEIIEGEKEFLAKEQKRKEEKAEREAKKEKAIENFVEKYGSERLKKGLAHNYPMTDEFVQCLTDYLFQDFNDVNWELDGDECGNEYNPSLEALELYDRVIDTINNKIKELWEGITYDTYIENCDCDEETIAIYVDFDIGNIDGKVKYEIKL